MLVRPEGTIQDLGSPTLQTTIASHEMERSLRGGYRTRRGNERRLSESRRSRLYTLCGLIAIQIKTTQLVLARVSQRICILGARCVSDQVSSSARCLALGLRIPPHTPPPTGHQPATTSPLRAEPELRVPTKPNPQTRRFRWPYRIVHPLRSTA